MLLDRFRKKKQNPPNGNGAPLEVTDVTKQVPQIDDVLAQVDQALRRAQKIEEPINPVGFCGC